MECGPEMEYRQKTSACNPTCANPDAPEQCNLADTENCVCLDPGHIIYEGMCVAAEICPCIDSNGATYEVCLFKLV